MEPTLHSGDLIWVDHTAYWDEVPVHGDVVVARHRGDRIVKRVVGVPGEMVEVRNGQVLIDGHAASDVHAGMPGPLSIERGRMGRDRYALLGDNRSEMASTLVHAVVSTADILGRVRFRIRLWPLGFGRVD